MQKKQDKRIWVYKPSPPKFTASQKAKMLTKVKELIVTQAKISQKVTRVDMRANRIYLYELFEQVRPEGVTYTKPLIDGKYLEFPYARITLLDAQGANCATDYQRHNNQWMTIYTGTLSECIASIEEDNDWF